MFEINVPSPIAIKDTLNGNQGQVVSLREWAITYWLRDVRWHENLALLVVAATEFNSKKRVLQFDDACFAVLREVVKAPRVPVEKVPEPLIVVQFEAFKNAVLNANQVSGDAPSHTAA